MSNAVVEKVARAIADVYETAAPWECYCDEAQAALAALKPGDEFNGLRVDKPVAFKFMPRTEELVSQARAAAIDECARWLEKEAQQFTEPLKTVMRVKAHALRALKDKG